MKKYLGLAFILICLLAFTSSSFAAVNLKGGTYARIRHEYYKNYTDMDNDRLDNRNYFRFKFSLWGQADFSKEISLFARLTDEFRAYTYYAPSSSKITGKLDKYHRFDINETVFDNLYLNIKNFLKYPVDLCLGRQDLVGLYGESFLIADGTPGDGGRTAYFNAAKASWRADEKNTLDFIYINNPRDDIWLPVINEDKAPWALTTTTEQAGVLYWKNKESVKNLNLEGYYIYKREGEDSGTGYQAQKGKINTFGSFAKYNLAPYVLRGQLALQFGKYGTEDRRGLGGYVFADRTFKDVKWSPLASAGYIYLSGDKRSSTKNEGWDPLFNRTPWISEIYAVNIGAETGISAYWTNLSAWRTSLALATSKNSKVTLMYSFLKALAQVVPSYIFSGEGRNRGQLLQGRLDYTINKYANAYFLAEYLIPGNFYKDNDPAMFLRTELQLKF
jgi:hypothetical protein